jgi:lipopolysaccharide exporter
MTYVEGGGMPDSPVAEAGPSNELGSARRSRGGLRQGLAWSSLSSVLLRIGTFATGVVLAHLLVPREFGVFAVALTVQTVLITLADLGLSSDLIRSHDAERKAATVATLGLVSGTFFCVIMMFSSGALAHALGSPAAGPVIAVLAVSLLIAGAGVVPYAKLLRGYEQKKLFVIALADFAVSTVVTVVLVLIGTGAMALAIGRICAQIVTVSMQYLLAHVRPRFGFDRTIVKGVLAFGIPVAAANMLSWALLNADNLVVSRVSGPVALGFYYLAFNISNWPMSAVGQVVRSVALPTFARVSRNDRDPSFAMAMGPVWGVTFLIGLMLVLLARPIIHLLYGSSWESAAPALMTLGLFGCLRTIFDSGAAYLLARGRAVSSMCVQAMWLILLVPALVLGTHLAGIAGTGAAHLIIAGAVVLPALLFALRRAGCDIRAVLEVLWPPILAGVPAAACVWAVQQVVGSGLAQLLIGGLLGTAVYLLVLGKWLRSRLRSANRLADLTVDSSVQDAM